MKSGPVNPPILFIFKSVMPCQSLPISHVNLGISLLVSTKRERKKKKKKDCWNFHWHCIDVWADLSITHVLIILNSLIHEHKTSLHFHIFKYQSWMFGSSQDKGCIEFVRFITKYFVFVKLLKWYWFLSFSFGLLLGYKSTIDFFGIFTLCHVSLLALLTSFRRILVHMFL